jgi:hypothetical protein
LIFHMSVLARSAATRQSSVAKLNSGLHRAARNDEMVGFEIF